jgi:NADPH:quinone reductase-like Zn-dependent oxidoreductase
MLSVQYKRYGGPEEMYLGEAALPSPGPAQVRVKVRAAAINPLDWKLRRGAMKLVTGDRFPKAMGSDFSGVVDAIGFRDDAGSGARE